MLEKSVENILDGKKDKSRSVKQDRSKKGINQTHKNQTIELLRTCHAKRPTRKSKLDGKSARKQGKRKATGHIHEGTGENTRREMDSRRLASDD